MTFSYWDEHAVLFGKGTWDLICVEAEKRCLEPEMLIEVALREYLEGDEE